VRCQAGAVERLKFGKLMITPLDQIKRPALRALNPDERSHKPSVGGDDKE
jgi:hypothetical protein